MDLHVPVLKDEVLRFLAIRPAGFYVDATFGRGGHARGILAQLEPQGRLLALDRDPDAVAVGRKLEAEDRRFSIVHSAYSALSTVLAAHAYQCPVDGILLDIGVSSPQLTNPVRGFGFRADGPLDMRMDPSAGESAAEWINAADEREIAHVLWRFGEERSSRRIAKAIVAARGNAPIQTTHELAAIVAAIIRGEPGRHPATRSFQAIRIHINRELDELVAALRASRAALAVGGRLCIISFHSLEDRLVKRFLRDHSRVDPALRGMPVVPEAALPDLKLITTKAQRASDTEVARNPRARSAVLRVAEKTR